jgi:streptogramin lyase
MKSTGRGRGAPTRRHIVASGLAGSLLGRLGSVLALLLTIALLVPAARAADRDLLVGTMPWDGAINQGSIQRFDGTTGAFLGYFVSPGAGGLNAPLFFVFGPDGNLYVSAAASVKRYNGTTGAYIDDFVALEDNYAEGLAFGEDGNLYVAWAPAVAQDWKIAKYDGATGAYIDDFVPKGNGGTSWVGDLVFGPDGNLYVVDGEAAILRYDGKTGASLGMFASIGSGSPFCMKFGPDGNLYVSLFYGQVIKRYDGNTGLPLGTISASWPAGVAFGPDENLYVAERYVNMGGTVKRFDGTTGAPMGVFAGPVGVQTELGLQWFPRLDHTPPTISAATTTSPNPEGWYNGDVTVHFTCTDAESGIPAGACPPDQILTPEGVAVESTARTVTDAAGNMSDPSNVVTVKIDKTAPIVSLVGGPASGDSYYFGAVPAAPTCSASDALSGLNGSCIVSGYATSLGSHTVTASTNDNAGNHKSASATYTVLAWTLKGFYQPTDMGGVINTVKNGSTVPLKFQVFAGTKELTSISSVNPSLRATEALCGGGPTDDIELLTAGETSLRYDGQFIYNWKTPKKPGFCYVVTVTLAEGTAISANFRMK